jgi:hypothetical protein
MPKGVYDSTPDRLSPRGGIDITQWQIDVTSARRI